MIEKLQTINTKLLKLYENDKEKKEKQILIQNGWTLITGINLIQKILQEPNCFLKMEIETAYAILKDLEIPQEKRKNIYLGLLDE